MSEQLALVKTVNNLGKRMRQILPKLRIFDKDRFCVGILLSENQVSAQYFFDYIFVASFWA